MRDTPNRWTRSRAAISIICAYRRSEGRGSQMDSALQLAPQYLPLSGGGIATDQSMRGFLAALEDSGELHRVKRSVDRRFEIASVLSLRNRGPAQLFEHVRGHGMPVVGNLLTSRD